MAQNYSNLVEQKKQADLSKGRPPEGAYSCRIVSATKKLSNKGNDMAQIEMKVVKGEQKGRKITTRFVFSVDFQWGDYLAFLEMAGFSLEAINSEAKMVAALEAISAAMPKCTLEVKHQPDKDGKPSQYYNVKNLVVEPVVVDEDDDIAKKLLAGAKAAPAPAPAPEADEDDDEVDAQDDSDEEEEEEEEDKEPAAPPAPAPVAPAAAPKAKAKRPY